MGLGGGVEGEGLANLAPLSSNWAEMGPEGLRVHPRPRHMSRPRLSPLEPDPFLTQNTVDGWFESNLVDRISELLILASGPCYLTC